MHHTSWVRLAIYAGFLVVAVVRLVIYIRRGR
jgi:hypothetical protein